LFYVHGLFFCVFVLPFRYWLFNLLSSVIIFQTPSSENILSSQYHFDLRTMQSRFFLWSEPSPEIRLPTCVHTLAWLQVISIFCSAFCSSSTCPMRLIVCLCGAYWFLVCTTERQGQHVTMFCMTRSLLCFHFRYLLISELLGSYVKMWMGIGYQFLQESCKYVDYKYACWNKKF
jgi:hypothetical protein